MILQNCNDFPRAGRILGVDWGARRTGVAVSDVGRDFVFVRDAIVARGTDFNMAAEIVRMALAEDARGIVMGLPLMADGAESQTTKMVKQCAAQIAAITDLPILFIEENLTSMAAQESLGNIKLSKIKKELDSESARVILENAIGILNRID